MARYFFFLRDSGTLKGGLTPTFDQWRKAADNLDVLPHPDVFAVSGVAGAYYFDATLTEDYWFILDTNDVAMSDLDRYREGYVSPSDGFIDVSLSSIKTHLTDIKGTGWTSSNSLFAISNLLTRTLGLIHENHYVDNTTFDSWGNLTAARMRIYSDAASVGTTSNVVATYSVSASFVGPGEMSWYKAVKV